LARKTLRILSVITFISIVTLANVSAVFAAPAAVIEGRHLRVGITDYAEFGLELLGGPPVGFQYPKGMEHLAVEWWGDGFTVGYSLVGKNVVKWTYPEWRNGIVPVNVTLPVKKLLYWKFSVVTETDDGLLRITHDFLVSRFCKHVIIIVTVTNIWESMLEGVVYKRCVDQDMDGTSGGDTFDYHPECNMCYAWETHYLGVAGRPAPDKHDLNGWDDRDVYDTDEDILDGPIGTDGLSVLHWNLGTLNPGRSKRVLVIYVAADSMAELTAEMRSAMSSIEGL